MEHVLSAAEQILRASGAPALRLGALLDELRVTTGERSLQASRLRSLLEGRPDRFRVLDPWRGPWRPVVRAEDPALGEPWVVAVRDGGDGTGAFASPRLVRRIRECVRWLGLDLDAASARRVVRWQALVLEGLAAERALRRAA
ncbi:MAG TPA: hypothetical protein VLH75_20680 [Longimicrobiales bacterium]|nr:hypothetical protein [Longimicrobiales bacterium]